MGILRKIIQGSNALTNSKLFTFSFYSISIIAAITGLITNQPYLSFFVTFFALLIGLSAFMSPLGSASASLLSIFSIMGLLEIFSPLIDLQFTWLIGILFVVIIGSVAIFQIRSKEKRLLFPSSSQIIIGIAAITPALVTQALLISQGNINGLNLGWMLPGDAQTNTSALMEIVSLNGFAGGLPSISQGIMAASTAAAMGTELSASYFIEIMQTQATVLASTWGFLSVLFGLIAAREFSRFGLLIRLSATLLAAAFPLTSFVLGFSLDAGFYNTPFALLSLAFAWIFWRELELNSKNNFWISAFFLSLTTFYALLAWAPVAIFPSFFILAIAIRKIISFSGFSKKVFFLAAILLLLFTIFILTIVLPRIGDLGKIVTADGWMTSVPPQLVIAMIMGGVLTAVLVQISPSNWGNPGLGLLVVSLAAFAGIGYLLLEGFSENQSFEWQYYPKKMAWMSVFFLLFLSPLIFLSSGVFEAIEKLWQKVLGIAAIFGLVGAAYLSIPFDPKELVRVFPLINVALNGQDKEKVIPEISTSIGKKVIRLDYDDNDFITNQWVFQWEKFKSDIPMWNYAYSLINSPKDVCEAAKTWGGEVTFMTRDEQTLSETLSLCHPLISKVIFE
jgi:hypothetical protein